MLLSVDPAANRQGEHGSVFVVIVAVIMLMSTLILLGFGGFRLMDNDDRVRKTTARQEFLIREMSAWVQRANALPCPADPAVDPASREFGFARKSCDAQTADGMIPFRTLNLAEHDARDGWGRFMTYRISPVLANADKGTSVFMRCRRFPWFDGDPLPPARQFNVHPQKARFCCPPMDGGFLPETDMQVFTSAADIPAGATIVKIGRKGDLSFYDDLDHPSNIGPQGSLAPVPPEAGNEELFAVALISHGTNGTGSYLGNGTGNRLSGNVGPDEQANIDAGKAVSRPINATPGLNYFDDVVLWRTQVSLMGELNGATCYSPWR